MRLVILKKHTLQVSNLLVTCIYKIFAFTHHYLIFMLHYLDPITVKKKEKNADEKVALYWPFNYVLMFLSCWLFLIIFIDIFMADFFEDRHRKVVDSLINIFKSVTLLVGFDFFFARHSPGNRRYATQY